MRVWILNGIQLKLCRLYEYNTQVMLLMQALRIYIVIYMYMYIYKFLL